MSYFRTNFELMHKHNISLTEIEGMIPFERDIYVSLVAMAIKKENERIEKMNRARGR